MGNSNRDIEEILKFQTVAVVGCSPKRERASHQVAVYLMDAGYRIIPVHPGHAQVLGEKCYPSLADIPEPIDVVDIFRKADAVLPIVQQAIEIRAKAVWLQDGIDAPEAVELARRHGLKVVSNDCFMRQHLSRLGR
ncbi:MAG: CoA-binding protein [Elusimicrobia bacterium]|nr:CoA-binding protein [Elusimicrobiota bacterium]